jgi:hypothetical protein
MLLKEPVPEKVITDQWPEKIQVPLLPNKSYYNAMKTIIFFFTFNLSCTGLAQSWPCQHYR